MDPLIYITLNEVIEFKPNIEKDDLNFSDLIQPKIDRRKNLDGYCPLCLIEVDESDDRNNQKTWKAPVNNYNIVELVHPHTLFICLNFLDEDKFVEKNRKMRKIDKKKRK